MLASLWPFNLKVTDFDHLEGKTGTEKSADFNVLQSETGWDRVRKMFQTDDFGNITPELNSTLQVGAMSMFIGAIYGGFIGGRNAYENFMRNNQATAFSNHFEAKKKLQDKVTLGFGKGAFRWGWRLTAFCTSYVGISTVISVYRGKVGFLENITAGLITGAGYKFNMGPRGWIVGGGLGAVLGVIAGAFQISYLKLTGMTIEEVRYWNLQLQHLRTEKFRKDLKEQVEKEKNSPFREYDLKSGITRHSTKDPITLEGVDNS